MAETEKRTSKLLLELIQLKKCAKIRRQHFPYFCPALANDASHWVPTTLLRPYDNPATLPWYLPVLCLEIEYSGYLTRPWPRVSPTSSWLKPEILDVNALCIPWIILFTSIYLLLKPLSIQAAEDLPVDTTKPIWDFRERSAEIVALSSLNSSTG